MFKKHNFSTAMKPYVTLRRMLVHPKDKRDPMQTADSVYEIPCNSCSKTYIGETGRLFKTRLSEHKEEAEKKIVPKISPGLKEKHLHQRLTNRLSLSMSRQTTTSSIGTKPRSLTKKQTKPLAGSKKPYGLGAGARTQ